VNLAGRVLYFYPLSVAVGQALALLVVCAGVLANAGSSLLGRSINREGDIPTSIVTTVSLGVGGGVLLATGLSMQGLPPLSPGNWAIVGWLAVVNTTFAFTLWNHTLRTLTAMESSIINSTMLIQIAILGWVFAGEGLTGQEVLGMVLAGLGALLVQLRRR
jgi:drug/metabolite transporter (DMT)-like permease